MKKLFAKIGAKGVFETVFPKANKTKAGRFASGIVKGATNATPLTFFQEFIKTFFDTNEDGRITAEDFKGMDAKTLGMALGFLIVFGLILKLIFGL